MTGCLKLIVTWLVTLFIPNIDWMVKEQLDVNINQSFLREIHFYEQFYFYKQFYYYLINWFSVLDRFFHNDILCILIHLLHAMW